MATRVTSFVAFVMQGVLALREQPWADNIGGIGTPKSRIKYEIINEESVDSVEGYKLTLELYYKTRDYRELHGNLTLYTKGVTDFSNIRFGWLFTEN